MVTPGVLFGPGLHLEVNLLLVPTCCAWICILEWARGTLGDCRVLARNMPEALP